MRKQYDGWEGEKRKHKLKLRVPQAYDWSSLSLMMHNLSLFFFLADFIRKDVNYEFLSTKKRGTCFFAHL
jgi:hypothetical protein